MPSSPPPSPSPDSPAPSTPPLNPNSPTPSPPAPPSSPPPSSPSPSPPLPPTTPDLNDVEFDVILVGAGAGGAAAAAFLQSSTNAERILVLTDGDDKSNLLAEDKFDDTVYNYFGKFDQREIPNKMGGASWIQTMGPGGNNLHNGGVHQLPPPGQLDTLLGGNGDAIKATTWLASAGPSSLAASATAECNDRDPTNLKNYYLNGPLGCSPLHRYAYCDSSDDECSLEASVASGSSSTARAVFGAMTSGLHKTSMWGDLVDKSASQLTISPLKGVQIVKDATGTRATGVQLSDGSVPRARCSVVLSAGVWGTAEILMRTFGLRKLGGLWEHAVLPVLDPLLYPGPDGLANTQGMDDSGCTSRLKAGNLHTPTRERAQAEFLICEADPNVTGDAPRLLAA
uniref:Glucose-methanol-choline oxidoreductase N-terminal domain-containing protein n=1 Tax=Chrysotila carterae TaxID=13221 RepID=A0A7S4F0F1_CHRCT